MDVNRGTRIELIRRVILAAAILLGVFLFMYVRPAVVTVVWQDFAAEQENLLDSPYYVGEEEKLLHELPLQEYIEEVTAGKVIQLEENEWGNFFNEVYLASSGQYEKSIYGDRISDINKDWYFEPGEKYVGVFFSPDELPIADWGLRKYLDTMYLSTRVQDNTVYLKAIYWDYRNPADRPYTLAPSSMYYPYKIWGEIFIMIGLLLAIFLPRVKPEDSDLTFSKSSIILGDIMGIVLLLLFYSLPFLISEGSIQSITGWWGLTMIFWTFAVAALFIMYANAWAASYQIKFNPDGIYRVTFKGIDEYLYSDIDSVNEVVLTYPEWFLKIYRIIIVFSALSGRGAVTTVAGPYMLAESAVYGGLALKSRDGRSTLVWYTDQNGSTILPGYERIIDECQTRGITYNHFPETMKGFYFFK